ncbi:MAG: ribosome maturation factor RimM [Tannerella sp.]|jgi:16S rRNA processing protein RimM|nr:ribosome maturation factor RimM [Tannerella sp.]
MIRKEETRRIGYFTKPHGIKGELSLVTDYDLFDDENDPFVICEMDGIPVPFFVESFRSKSNTVILLKLEDVDGETEAKKLINREVYYPENRLKTIPKDEMTLKSLTGYMLEGKNEGELGRINYVDETTINTLFELNFQNKALLVPVAEDLIDSIDHARQRIIVNLPEGLLDV